MSAFEMEFELTGLKIKIKSERSDAPQALDSVQSHIGSLLQAAAGLGTGAADVPVNASVLSQIYLPQLCQLS